MWKLAAILYPMVATTVAGIAVLVGLAAPQLGLDNMDGMLLLGDAGLVAGVPISALLAAPLAKAFKTKG